MGFFYVSLRIGLKKKFGMQFEKTHGVGISVWIEGHISSSDHCLDFNRKFVLIKICDDV